MENGECEWITIEAKIIAISTLGGLTISKKKKDEGAKK